MPNLRTPQHALQTAENSLQNMCRDSPPEVFRRRPGDDEQFGRLDEHRDVPLLHEEAADDRCKHQQNAYDGEHACLPGASEMWLPPAWMLASMAACARSSSCASVSP